MDKLRKCVETIRQLPFLEKLQLLVAVCWFCVGLLILCSPEIYKISYAIIWMLYLFTYTNKIFSDYRHRIQYKTALERWSDAAVRSYRYAREIERLTIALNNIEIKINGLPKVASATGQIYVDYEDVMKIIKGDDFVER